MKTILTLSKADLHLAKKTAHRIQTAKTRAHIVDRHIAAADGERLHFWGLVGEMAVCRALGQPPNLAVTLHGDGGYDFILDESTWDVKTRLGWALDLLIRRDRADFQADYALLCWLLPDYRVAVVGYVSRPDYFRDAVLDDKHRYILSWRKLRKFPFCQGQLEWER